MAEPYPEAPLNGARALDIDGEQPGTEEETSYLELHEYVAERAW